MNTIAQRKFAGNPESLAVASVLEARAGIVRPRRPDLPDLDNPAVAAAIDKLNRTLKECKDLLHAIDTARGMKQGDRRNHRFVAKILPKHREAALGRHTRHVYLKLFDDGIYKIGSTKHPDDRPGQLAREYQCGIRHNTEYLSPVATKLENAIQRQFAHFKVKRGKHRELFDLPLEVVAQFEVIAEDAERWVFNAEQARLELDIRRIETEYVFYRTPRAAADGRLPPRGTAVAGCLELTATDSEPPRQ